jgi:DNA-binding NarL/FixJ family response regulator
MKEKKKILLIEDDINLGTALQKILSFSNYDVSLATNGASGVQKAFQLNPDLILCDINMYPVDGYQVFKLLEESSLLSHIPFIFLTGSAELNDIRYGMGLGADDYLIKPVGIETLIKTIEKRLQKFSAIQEEARKSFNRLFEISPTGLVLFNEHRVVRANPAFRKISGIDAAEVELPVCTLWDSDSCKTISERIRQLKHEHKEQVVDHIKFSDPALSKHSGRLFISEFDRFTNETFYLGIFSPDSGKSDEKENQDYVDEIYQLLNRENIKVSEALGQKIMDLFRDKGGKIQNPPDSIFTAREIQVLNLSMEGLSIKVIAERLNISDRTVEKHRTRLMVKTGASNMIEVIVFALKHNLIEI